MAATLVLDGAPSARGVQIVAAWPAGPLEARVAFDRPIDAAVVTMLAGRAIAFDEALPAASRPAARWPAVAPRQAVTAARTESPTRGSVRIAAARLIDGGRTLVLSTDPHPRQAVYTLALSGVRSAGPAAQGTSLEAVYDLAGVEVAWDDGREGAQAAWSGWWPHLDPEVARDWTRSSAEHQRGWALLSQPGRLTLHTTVVLPAGRATLSLAAGGPFEATIGGENLEPVADPRGGQRAAFDLESTGEPVDLAVAVRTGAGERSLSLRVTYHSDADPTERPLSRARLLLPWAPAVPSAAAPGGPLPNLAGGDPVRGEAVFFSDEAKCVSCHRVRGQGGIVGPDLSDLARHDRAWIYRAIAEPSAVIHPEYVAYTVVVKDGRVVVGVVRAEGADVLLVTDTNAQTTRVRRAEVEELRPSATSIMPVALAGALGEARLRDLIAFLATPPSSPSGRPKR
jgi:putative heme-binding domain-containing protein